MRASVLVLLVGCWSAAPPPPTLPPPAPAPSSSVALRSSRATLSHSQRCAKSLATVFDVSRDELAVSGLAPDVVDELEEAFVASCELTQWADEVLDCISAITSVAEWNPCQDQMSQEQKDDSLKRAFEILQKRNAIPPNPPPPP